VRVACMTAIDVATATDSASHISWLRASSKERRSRRRAHGRRSGCGVGPKGCALHRIRVQRMRQKIRSSTTCQVLRNTIDLPTRLPRCPGMNLSMTTNLFVADSRWAATSGASHLSEYSRNLTSIPSTCRLQKNLFSAASRAACRRLLRQACCGRHVGGRLPISPGILHPGRLSLPVWSCCAYSRFMATVRELKRVFEHF